MGNFNYGELKNCNCLDLNNDVKRDIPVEDSFMNSGLRFNSKQDSICNRSKKDLYLSYLDLGTKNQHEEPFKNNSVDRIESNNSSHESDRIDNFTYKRKEKLSTKSILKSIQSTKKVPIINSKKLNDKDFNLIYEILLTVNPSYIDEDIDLIISKMSLCNLERNQVILDSNCNLNVMYIIKEGKLGLFSSNQLIDVFCRGQCIGDFSLFNTEFQFENKYPNGWSYKCMDDSQCYAILSENIQTINKDNVEKRFKDNYNIINNSKILSYLDEIIKITLTQNLIKVNISDVCNTYMTNNTHSHAMKEIIKNLVHYENDCITTEIKNVIYIKSGSLKIQFKVRKFYY